MNFSWKLSFINQSFNRQLSVELTRTNLLYDNFLLELTFDLPFSLIVLSQPKFVPIVTDVTNVDDENSDLSVLAMFSAVVSTAAPAA